MVPGVEDVSHMSLLFPSGRFATIHNSWLEPRKVREMTIVGTKRMIVYDDVEPLQKVRIYDVRVDTPAHYDTFAEFQWSYHYGDMYAPHIEQSESLRNECQHFLKAIRYKRRPLTDGNEGLQLVKVLEAASESLKQRGVSIDIEPEGAPAEGSLTHAKKSVTIVKHNSRGPKAAGATASAPVIARTVNT